MTVVATQNNPTSEKSVKVDIDRGKQVFSAADLYKQGDNRFTGDVLPNAGDRVFVPWFEDGYHMLVTSVDYKTLNWVHEQVNGDAWSAWSADLERDQQNKAGGIHMDELTMGAGLVHVQVEEKPEDDKGLAAKAKLAARTAARKTAQLIRWSIWVAISLTIICAALVVSYGYKTMVTGHLSDERPCAIDFGGDMVVGGKRTFNYPFKEIYGFRMVDTSKISERTVVDVRGDAMTIVGLKGKQLLQSEDWSINVGAGERGIQILKDADVYTFVVNTGKGQPRVRTITHDAMCKG